MNRYTFKGQVKYSGNHYDYKEWVIGDLIHKDGKTYIYDTEEVVMDLGNGKHGYPGARFEEVEIIPETLCQCTGLQDIDGNYIFENDIIDINQTVNGCNLFKIVWDKYKWNAEYYVKMTTPRLYEYNFEELLDINYFEKDIKIIGNKFDKEVE